MLPALRDARFLWRACSTRRRAVLTLVALQGPALFGPHYPSTPFDDLLSRLPDRENASRLGSAVLKQETSFDAQAAAAQLRSRMGSRTLADVMNEDLQQRRLTEVHGWVLPETLTTLCALAAATMPAV